MTDAVIVGAVRTPVGRRNGSLSGIHPVDLSAHVLTALGGVSSGGLAVGVRGHRARAWRHDTPLNLQPVER